MQFRREECLQSLDPYSFLIELYPKRPGLEETPTITTEQGGTAEAAIDGVNETIDSMINRGNFLVADWLSRGEMAEEQ
jgi:hypothetical protein